jgi:hypothetical protein
MRDAMLQRLLVEYPTIRERYEGFVDDPGDIPHVNDVNGFRRLIGLSSVHVHPVVRDEMPYVGFEFGCTWDNEHGLGVLMHGTRVVKLGGADTSFLLWIAEEDAREDNRTDHSARQAMTAKLRHAPPR